ncbi:YXWGXW repeat-containing protein [Agrobacterium sp. S2]|nr:YXWGXW repeat-containing protein [Agrobacterium sp. S2]
MKKDRRLFLQTCGALLFLPGVAWSQSSGPRAPVGRRPPPPPDLKEETPSPRKGYRWVPGRWVWSIRRSRHVWIPGHFQRRRP